MGPILRYNIYDFILLRVTTVGLPRIYNAPDYEDGYNPRGGSHPSSNVRSRVPEAEQQQGDKEHADSDQISHRHYLETVEPGMR